MGTCAALLACLLIGGIMPFQRGDMPERPPVGYRDLPLPDGWRETQRPTLAEVKAYCVALGAQAHARAEIAGCASPYTQEIVVPALGRAVDAKRQAGIREHEIGHVYGLNHSDPMNPARNAPRGWFDQAGNRVRDMTPEQAAAFRAQVAPGNLFAQTNPQQPKNLFRAR